MQCDVGVSECGVVLFHVYVPETRRGIWTTWRWRQSDAESCSCCLSPTYSVAPRQFGAAEN